MDYTHYKTCRICGSNNLLPFLNLGNQPPANALIDSPNIAENFYPLQVYYCEDCGLIQLTDVIDPSILFNNYNYFTGYSSQTMRNHFKCFAEQLKQEYQLGIKDLIIDIGGNDGSFLENFIECKRLNVEPSIIQALESYKKGIPVETKFFSSQTAREIVDNYGKAKIITASNVFAHLDNLHDFMAGIRQLMAPDSVFIIEVAHALNLIQKAEWDTVYHEHLSYFTLSPLHILGSQFGLNISKVEEIPTHGGSIRVFFTNAYKGNFSYNDTIKKEYAANLYRPETFLNFQERVNTNKSQLLSLLSRLKQDGKSIIGYGSPAKATVLANYCNLKPYLDYIIDTTPSKQGKFSPGQHIPILKPEYFHQDNPDYALMFAWNYKDEILAKEQDFLNFGGHFIIPLPEVQVI